MQLVDDWKRSLGWFSQQAFIAAGALQAVWLELPADLKGKVPPDAVHYLTAAILVLGFVGRLVKQGR